MYRKIGTAVPPGPVTIAGVEVAGSPSEAKAIVADAVGMAPLLLVCAGADPFIDRTPELLLPLADDEADEGAGASSDPVTVDPSERIEVYGTKEEGAGAGFDPVIVDPSERIEV